MEQRNPGMQLDDLDAAKLTPIVQQILNSQTATVIQWRYEQLSGGVGRGTAVYRVSGQAQDGSQTLSWSLILKTLNPVPGEYGPSHWFYWKREAEAYRSGWLENLPGGVAAPHCYGVEEQPDGSYWLWLEDVKDDIGCKWPLEHYGIVARHLGQFNGAYLTGEPMPTYPWLSRDGIRAHVESAAPVIQQIPQVQDRPLIRRWLAHGTREELFRLWEERERWLRLLDRLPQTICHFDAFRRNILTRHLHDDAFQSVMIDWSYTGWGPIGAEIHHLVYSTLSFLEIDIGRVYELEQIVLDGYIQGLRDAGWRGDPQLVEMGYSASGILTQLGRVGEALPGLMQEIPPIDVQAVFGRSREELVDLSKILWRALSLPDRARRLAEGLGMSWECV